MIAVTFDFGQTLAALDFDMLARRVGERGHTVEAATLAAAEADGWTAYGRITKTLGSHREAWLGLMQTLLAGGGIRDGRELAVWLFSEQPRKNLWRKPIPGMFELCRDLAARDVPLGIVSNSEGHLLELCTELGLMQWIDVLADSGVLGIEKPDRRVFEWTAERLGVAVSEIVHVGDAWNADVVGALEAGARAIWYSSDPPRELPSGVVRAETADEIARALAHFGV